MKQSGSVCVELNVNVGRDRLAYDAAVTELLSFARRQDLQRVEGSTEDSLKGPISDVVFVVNGSASAAAVVAVVRLWLRRDRTRALTVRIITDGNVDKTVEITGDYISLDILEDALRRAIDKNT